MDTNCPEPGISIRVHSCSFVFEMTMPKNVRFWLNVILISAGHVVVIGGLVRWSREPKNPSAQSIVWMNGGAGDGAAAKTSPLPKPVKNSTPAPKPEMKEEPEDEQPVLTSAKSDIQLPATTPTPSPRSTSTASPARTPRPSPSPKVKATPRPSPKPKPKPTPKPSPKKLVVAKASPKPTPEEAKSKEETKEDVDLAKEPEKKPDESPKSAVAPSGTGKGTSSGSGGRIGGAGGQSQFGWYGSMLHDRFYSEWVQPTSIAATGAKNSVLAKLRIEKDGRISSFDIVRSSGNTAVDESVSAAAKRVTHVDALPTGLGNGEHYDVKINFELNSE